MTIQELAEEIHRQPVYRSGGVRAPHKMLAILFAIGRSLANQRMTPYSEAEKELTTLLDEFGPPRETQHPEHPVWRLRVYRGTPTTFWQLDGPLVGIEDAAGNPSPAAMRESISFGLSEDASELLRRHPVETIALAATLAARIVPPTRQMELLEAVGIGLPDSNEQPRAPALDTSLDLIVRTVSSVQALVRDRRFPPRVRDAYGSECAVCSISPLIENKLFGLEAAHIRWANAGGPDEVQNGILLCSMHHHALDRGAIKVDEDLKVRVSPRLGGNEASDRMFGRFEGERIALPKDRNEHPHPDMLAWNWKQVF